MFYANPSEIDLTKVSVDGGTNRGGVSGGKGTINRGRIYNGMYFAE